MSAFTEPLTYRATDEFVAGRIDERPMLIDGQVVMVAELVGGRRLYEIERGFVYKDTRTGLSVTVEAGFRTDLGSIPGIARFALSPDDPWAAAYVVHDRCYAWLRKGIAPMGFTRAAADLMLWDALAIPYRVYTREGGELVMRRAVCASSARTAIYYAVRVGGRPSTQRR